MSFQEKPLELGVYSSAASVKGQGVGSAYQEQVDLLKEKAGDLIHVHINERGPFAVQHFHTINPNYYLKMKRNRLNIAYCHFLPDTLLSSLKIPGLIAPLVSRYVISFYNKADYIVVVNPSFIEDLKRYNIPEEKIVYIPNFVSDKIFHDLGEEVKKKQKKALNIEEDAFVVLGCGQVQTRKGVQDFVEVALENPDMEFVWVGGFSFGKLTEGYEELKKIMEHPPKNVHFPGIVEREQMPLYYTLADVLFVPSYSELFPMTILEAANHHLPIVTRDLKLYEAILFDDYLKADDNAGFGALLKKLKAEKDFYQHCSQKAKKLAEYYSADHVLQLWLAFYQKAYDSKFLVPL